MIDTMTTDAPAPLIVRAHLCRADFHVWVSAGPPHPRQLCNCGRIEWQHSEDCLERIGPPIFVNGRRVAEAVAALTESEAADE